MTLVAPGAGKMWGATGAWEEVFRGAALFEDRLGGQVFWGLS